MNLKANYINGTPLHGGNAITVTLNVGVYDYISINDRVSQMIGDFIDLEKLKDDNPCKALVNEITRAAKRMDFNKLEELLPQRKVFSTDLNQEQQAILNQIEKGEIPLYAVDEHITVESNMVDDYIALVGEYAILAVPSTDVEKLKKFLHKNYFLSLEKATFKPSGNLEKPSAIGEEYLLTETYDIYFIKDDKVVKGTVNNCALNLNNVNSYIEKMLLKKQWEKIELYNSIQEKLETKTYFQNGNIKKEDNIDKVVRYCNSTPNKYIGDKLWNDMRYNSREFGVSSPKRNPLHLISAINDINLLIAVWYSMGYQIEENMGNHYQINDDKFVEILELNHEFVFKYYNYHKRVVCLFDETLNVWLTFKTRELLWYNEFERGQKVTSEELKEFYK